MTNRLRSRYAVAAALFTALAPVAHAQSWPTQPIRIIVPFAPGGLNDVVARAGRAAPGEIAGQPVVIDNRPGASGIVGSSAAAKAAPDGHTLLMVASSYTILPATQGKLPYDPERDLAPVGMVAKNSLLFLVNRARRQDAVRIRRARQDQSGQAQLRLAGGGDQTHLVIELFSRLAGIQLQHILYRGGAPAIQAMLADDTQFTVISTLLALPQIQAGSLRAIAIGGLRAEAQLPDVPTVAEQGFPGFEAVQWVGCSPPRARRMAGDHPPQCRAQPRAQGSRPDRQAGRAGSVARRRRRAADFAKLIGSDPQLDRRRPRGEHQGGSKRVILPSRSRPGIGSLNNIGCAP